MSAPGLVCLKKWGNDSLCRTKDIYWLEGSFTHWRYLLAHLLRVPCAVRSPAVNIKIRYIYIISVKKL